MKINDKVICINNDSKNYILTLYKEYKIIDIDYYVFSDDMEIQIIDDDSFNIWISAKRFITKQELRKMKLNSI